MSGRLGAIAVLAAATAASLAVSDTCLTRVRHPGTASSSGVPAIRDLGPTPAQAQISFALSLRMDDRALNRFFEAITDPASPLVGHTISPAAIGRRFGAPDSALARIRADLAARGIRVVRTYPQRTEIDARATVATLSRTFQVRYHDFSDRSGTRFHAPTGNPTIPASLTGWVADVVGLSTRPVVFPADVRGGALVPADAAVAYDVAPLRRLGIDGTGLTIAIASFQRFGDSDVDSFSHSFSLKGPDPQHVVVGSGAGDPGEEEAALDVEVIRGIAPGARILEYEAPKTIAGELSMLNQIAGGPSAIASDSWGLCDSGVDPAARAAVEHAFRAAALHGTTFFVASGDTGAYDCQARDFADHRLTVDFPSDSPNVVSVGGTTLTVQTDGTYLSEAGWEEPLENAGGGGGISPVKPAPSWQVTYRIGKGTHRVVPDVSANANTLTGWAIVAGGKQHVIGGTSAAAPFWAGAMLLVQQFVQRHGITSQCFLAPLLYQLAETRQAFPAFHDVVLGGNRYYDAARGWDYASGLGSPDVFNLARDLAAERHHHGGACNAAGGK